MNTVSSSGTEARSVKSRSVPAKRIVAGVIAAGAIVTGIGAGAGIASAAPPPQGNHYQQPNRWQPQPQPNRWHPQPQWHPQPRWQPGQYTPNGFWLFGFWIPLP